MISQVERLATAGFALHWLHKKSKRPIGNDWAAVPVASVKKLKDTYREGNNLGVRLGQWSVVGGLFLHIIDFDVRTPECADEAKAKLAELLPELDLATIPTVLSGSGGASRHFYILSDKAFRPRKFAHSTTFQMVWDDERQKDVKKWDWELHLLGTGSQAVIPPSIHPDTDKPYRWLREFDFDMLDLGIVEAIPSAAIERLVGYDEPETVDPERLKPMGISFEEIHDVLNDVPFEEWFEDRDGWMRVGMALHHETGGSDEGFALWCEFSKRSKKFDLDDSKRVWKSFKNRAGLPFRMASLVAVARDQRVLSDFDDVDDFEEVPEPGMFDDLLGDGPSKPQKPSKSQKRLKKEDTEIALGRGAPDWVRKLNSKHAVARVSGKTVIMDFHPDGRVSYGSVNDLNNFYENDRRPKDDTTVPVTKLWMQHKQRRSYPNGIVFLPNRDIDGAYNHWQGFSVEPDGTKSCKRFLAHLLEVFCNRNVERYEYMLGWLAHMVQRPEDKPGVAVVAKGKKRIGKDTVFEYVGEMIRHHYITVANKDQLVGKFNQHQEKCLLLHVQEGFWAGDKRDEGPLKYLITSRDVMIEPKGMNAFPVKSVLRLFISSNERWVVPATEDEGRFFVLNVSDVRRNDHNYFGLLREEMENGGPAALLDYLLNYDISNFQVRKVPDTDALAEQKVEGLKNIERWWFGVLEHGSMEDLPNTIWARDVVRVPKDSVRGDYARWMRSRRYDGEEVSETEFTRRLSRMCPQLGQSSPRNAKGGRDRMFVLPDLDVCRQGFEKFLGSEIIWPEDQLIEDTTEEDDLG